MTAKLKLKCLATDRPALYDTTLLTFLKLKATGRLVGTGIAKADSPWAQMSAQHADNLFYLEACTVSTFLSENDLVELPDEPEREAYQKAKNAWYSSSLGDTASRHSYSATKELFISHELLKAGYTISDELYDKYC
jgi:hypothetical protein